MMSPILCIFYNSTLPSTTNVMELACLSFYERMGPYPIELGSIKKNSTSFPIVMGAIQLMLVVLHFMLPWAFHPLSSKPLGDGLLLHGRFIFVIIPLSKQNNNSRPSVYTSIKTDLLLTSIFFTSPIPLTQH